MGKIKHLFLLRHASVDRSGYGKDIENSLSEEGLKELMEVASATRDYLAYWPSESNKINKIYYSPYKACKECALKFSGALNVDPDSVLPEGDLSPEVFYPVEKKTEDLAARISSQLKSNNINGAMFIGHEPQLGWLAQLLLGKKKGKIVLSRAELACIEIYFTDLGAIDRKKSQLIWTVAPSDPVVIDSITQKIKSKMEIAKTFGSVITLLLTFSLGILIDESKINFLKGLDKEGHPRELNYLLGGLFRIPFFEKDYFFYYCFVGSIGLLFLSLILFLSTMSSYDSLLMPSRFWSNSFKSKSPNWLVKRPPSSSARILYLNMMRVWKKMFVPATRLLIIALLGVSFVVFHFILLEYLVIIGLGWLGYFLYHKKYEPNLGAED